MSDKRVLRCTTLRMGKAQRVELVIDVVGRSVGSIYCTKPGGRSSFVGRSDDGERLWSEPVSRLVGVASGRERSLFTNRHYVDLEWDHGAVPVRLFMSGNDAKTTVAVLEPRVAENRRRRVSELCWQEMLKEFNASSVVDLEEYARTYASVLDEFSLGPGELVDDEVAAADEAFEAQVHRRRIDELLRRLRDSIAQGQLNGVLDTGAAEYRDRSFVIAQQRVVNVSVDFNDLVAKLGNRGIVLQRVECPECGAASSDIPNGSHFTCQYCRATVRAIDLFEKYRGVL